MSTKSLSTYSHLDLPDHVEKVLKHHGIDLYRWNTSPGGDWQIAYSYRENGVLKKGEFISSPTKQGAMDVLLERHGIKI